MRVARTVAPGDTRIEEVPDPEPAPGEVVCRVLACATCGSDVHGWYVERKLPAVLGHEPAGEVVAVGDGVSSVAVGDRVAIHHHAPCGACERCRAGHETLCATFRSTRLDPGGFAEYVRLSPELVAELLPLDGLDPVLATFVEPVACVLRGLRRVGAGPADSLLVVGAGCSGLLHVACADVASVHVAEVDDQRLQRALRWGARAWDGSPVSVAVVTSASAEAVRLAASALDVGGRLLLYAPGAPDVPLGLDGWSVFERELTVTSSWSAGPADMRASLELLKSGVVAPLELVQLRVGLEETGRALAAQASGEALKAVVLP